MGQGTGYSVDAGDLKGIAAAFNSASSEIAHLKQVLSSQAHAPTSSSVSHDAGTASKYATVLEAWTRNLGTIANSLDSLAKSISAAVSVYEQTETNNTVKP